MSSQRQKREEERNRLIEQIVRMGHPPEFGALIADSLGTEKSMGRMISCLRKTGPQTAEQIADEMLAIVDARDRWVEKKKNEYYNRKYNQMRCTFLAVDDEEE